MLPKDFRGYLDYLEKNGKLLRVKKEVDVKHELAAGIRKVSDTDGPALLFENIRDYPDWRVAGGVYATRKLMALALETEPDEGKLLQRYLECGEKRVKPKLVPTGPVKEIIIKGEDIDLTKLPVPTYNAKDCGPYICAGVEINKHPETGKQNVSICARLVLGKDKLELVAPAAHQTALIVLAGEERGQGVGVATVLGAPPELTIASQIKAPMGVDETEIAGAFRGEPLEVVKCETIDVEVPAHAEVIIEGITIPGERVFDGPFGEYRGDYHAMLGGGKREGFVTKITAITMRKDPIFHAILTGMPMTENHWLKKWAMASDLCRLASKVVLYPEDIKGVNVTEGGSTCNAVVSIHKRNERTPRDIIYTLLSSQVPIWNVIVVDEDVDVYDHLDVERAWATRVVPSRDIYILPYPPETTIWFAKRWGIDATMPLGKEREFHLKARPPGVDKVDYV